jgi:hypothetical protein
MSLVQAIDQAVAFVRAHLDEMTRAEMDEFHRLAESVYLLAFRAGLERALPQVSELQPQLESDQLTLPPARFESKLHLPGDWERVVPAGDDDLLLLPLRWQDVDDLPATPEWVFLVCASPRWVHDMDVLRKLAEQQSDESLDAQQPAGNPPVDQYVTRDQIASLVKRHKDTVADWFNDDDPQVPEPAIEGGGGKRHEYLWSKVRPWLEKKTGRSLPPRFPDLGPN